MAPDLDSPFFPIISVTPHFAAILTLPPKEGQRRMHMAHPLPYFVQWRGGPAVPVVSMKTSPSKRTFSSPVFPYRRDSAIPHFHVLTRVSRRISMPFAKR